MSGSNPPPVVVVQGDDPDLVARAVREVVDRLAGDAERSLAVDDFRGDEYDLGQVAGAAATPPFLVDRRVVVAWGAQRFARRSAPAADDDEDEEPSGRIGAPVDGGLEPLLAYLSAPLASSTLVLEWAPTGSPPRSPRMPKALTDAVRAVGGERTQVGAPRRGKERTAWFDARVSAAGLRLRPAARDLVLHRLGEDVARVDPLLDALVAVHGPGASLDVDDVAPYVGEAGDVLPWDLTDALAAGDTAGAIGALERMLGAGRHPLQVLATLSSYHRRLLGLDGDERPPAELAFPERKAAEHLRGLGRDGLRRAVALLAEADVDLRGGVGYPDESSGGLVLEVLVARLSRLVRPPSRGRGRRGR